MLAVVWWDGGAKESERAVQRSATELPSRGSAAKMSALPRCQPSTCAFDPQQSVAFPQRLAGKQSLNGRHVIFGARVQLEDLKGVERLAKREAAIHVESLVDTGSGALARSEQGGSNADGATLLNFAPPSGWV
jgi:hypothetical protein